MNSSAKTPDKCVFCGATGTIRLIIPKFRATDRGHALCTRCGITFDTDIEDILAEELDRSVIEGIASRDDYMKLFVETWEIGDADTGEAYTSFDWENNEAMRRGVAAHVIRAIEAHGAGLDAPEILDVGCGTGFTTILFAEKYGKENILGIDPSPSVRVLAQKHGIPALHGTLDTVVLPDASRDVVVIIGNLMLHRDPGYTLKEAQRLLRPGGLLVADYKNMKSAARQGAMLLARLSPGKLAMHPVVQRNFVNMRYGMQRRHMDRYLKDAGFAKITDYSKPPRLLEFPNASDHQAGAKGRLWRALDRIDTLTDNRAWIQVMARKPEAV